MKIMRLEYDGRERPYIVPETRAEAVLFSNVSGIVKDKNKGDFDVLPGESWACDYFRNDERLYGGSVSVFRTNSARKDEEIIRIFKDSISLIDKTQRDVSDVDNPLDRVRVIAPERS